MLVYEGSKRSYSIMIKDKIMQKEITALEDCSIAELKEKFSELFGFECGATNARNLRARLMYKLQEIFLGGLTAEDKALLDAVADKDPAANLKPADNKPRPLAKGTRLCRDWKGRTYEVFVRDDGKFEYNGELYRSLSAVASEITGTHWNGKKFFGVK